MQHIEIDSGSERVDGVCKLHVRVTEADGLRRRLVTFTLTDEQIVSLVRGGAFVAPGTRAVEMDGGDALLDALDVLTSADGKRTDRSAANIADDLLDDLGMNRGQARPDYVRSHVLRQALRGTAPRKVAK